MVKIKKSYCSLKINLEMTSSLIKIYGKWDKGIISYDRNPSNQIEITTK